MLQGVLEPKP